MSTLPATSEFPAALRAMTGSSILANGFNVAFSGGYASISGTIASSQLTFSGTAGGAITGHVLGLGTQTLSISGSAQVFLDRPGTNKWPAGVFFRVRYMPKKETYLEVPVNGP